MLQSWLTSRALLLLLLVATGPGVLAIDANRAPTQYMYRHWDRTAGLPADTVWAVHQSELGFLWIATEGGLVRFDGADFKTYNRDTTDAFIADDVRDIAEAPDDTLWAATFGSGLIRVRGDEVTRFDKKNGLINDVVYSTHVAANGDVWAGTASGVCRLRGDKFRCWTPEDGIAKGRIVRMTEDTEGRMWFASLVDGLTMIDHDKVKTFRVESGLTTPQIFMLMTDPELGVVIGTYNGDYHHVVDQTIVPLDRGDLPEGLIPLSSFRDRDRNLWIGTNGGEGVWRMRPEPKKLNPSEHSLSHVFGMTEDQEGGIWIGSTMGLHQYRAGPFVPWGAPEGVANGTFVVAAASRDGIWAGSEGNGLYRLHVDGRFTNFTMENGLPSDSVSSLLLSDAGVLWVGTFGGGVAWFENDAVTRVISADEGLAGNQVVSLFQTPDGAVWIGTAAGLQRWDGDQITHTFTTGNGLLADLVRDIKMDHEDNLLLSSDSGLVRFSLSELEVVDTFNRDQGLADDVVATTYVDDRGVIWIGGRNGGLSRLDGDTLFHFTREHNIGVPSVMSIIQDQTGYLWFAGRRGVARVARDELDAVAFGNAASVHAQAFSERDGMRAVRVSGGYQSPGVITPDGRLWYATSRGLVVVNPSQLVPPAVNPTALIQRVVADGKPVAGGAPFRIPAGTRSVEIEYTVPSVNDADRLRFRYRMAADGDRWQEAGARRTAFFTSLPPRRNYFEVAVSHGGQPFDDTDRGATRVELYVMPMWYQTYLARTAAVVTLVLLAWGAYLTSVRRLRASQKRLEQLVGERTTALREALEKVEQMSRTDILTGLSNRRHFEERLSRDWTRAVETRTPISVMMLDIDYFKQFNDTAGHQEGDRCLKQVAAALARSVRDDDFVARYGGEEFVVLLAGSDVNATAMIGRRIQESVSALNLPHPGRPPGSVVTVSAGFATAEPGVIDSVEELVRRADEALYRAKELGRDQVVMHRDMARAASG